MPGYNVLSNVFSTVLVGVIVMTSEADPTRSHLARPRIRRSGVTLKHGCSFLASTKPALLVRSTQPLYTILCLSSLTSNRLQRLLLSHPSLFLPKAERWIWVNNQITAFHYVHAIFSLADFSRMQLLRHRHTEHSTGMQSAKKGW